MTLRLVDIGSFWRVLPPGIHGASLDEVEKTFATNPRRKEIFNGFVLGCETLEKAGCLVVYLDGSFVTGKDYPGDFDACWYPTGVDVKNLDPVLLDFKNKRAQQKKKYGGEFFPTAFLADGIITFLDYFQIDKYTGDKKGIIQIQLR